MKFLRMFVAPSLIILNSDFLWMGDDNKDELRISAELQNWVLVDADVGLQVGNQRTTATRVVESLRFLDEVERSRLHEDLNTIDGTRDMLMRLEHCIQSERFQSRIWQKVQEMDPSYHGKKRDLEEDTKENTSLIENADLETERDFVLVNHTEVIDALAEHLVLTYLENFHANEISAIRKSREAKKSWFLRLVNGIGKFLGTIARTLIVDSLWSWGVSLATSTAGLATIAAINPAFGAAVMTIIWKVLKISFGLLL